MNKHKENAIREKRTIEATKKNLMGPSGKFGIILQAFGTPVIRQGTSLFDSSFLNDPYEEFVYSEYGSTSSGQQGPLMYRDEIKTADADFAHNEGILFDGLSRGMHLEIVYWHADSQLKVSFKGYPVYIEIAGELEAYAPSQEWEDLIERLHNVSKDKIKQNKSQQEKELAEKIQERKNAFWQNIKMRWGL